jgi:hypothetical protein
VLFGRLGLKNERLDCSFVKRSPSLRHYRVVLLHNHLGYVVKWLIALVLILSLHTTGQDLCSVREFYSMAYGIHDPTERHKQMKAWLTKHQTLCKSTDFIVIWNNMSEWGGTADSHDLRALVIHGYKEALKREK